MFQKKLLLAALLVPLGAVGIACSHADADDQSSNQSSSVDRKDVNPDKIPGGQTGAPGYGGIGGLGSVGSGAGNTISPDSQSTWHPGGINTGLSNTHGGSGSGVSSSSEVPKARSTVKSHETTPEELGTGGSGVAPPASVSGSDVYNPNSDLDTAAGKGGSGPSNDRCSCTCGDNTGNTELNNGKP